MDISPRGTVDGVMRARVGLLIVAIAAAATAFDRPAAAEPPPLEFIRVHAPAGRSEDVPLDADRYVPMSAPDFDRAVAARDPAGRRPPTPGSRAASARYEARLDGAGRLVGSLAFELDAVEAAASSFLPLGDIDALHGSVRTAGRVGELVVFGLPDGTVAVRTPGVGSYSCEFTCPLPAPGTREYRLPLVPALKTSLTLRLPPGVRPLVAAPAVVQGGDASAGLDELVAWSIEVGPAAVIHFRLAAREEAPALRSWSHVVVRGRRADVVTRVQPDRGWNAGPLVFGLDAGLEPTAVRIAETEASGAGGGELAWRFGPGRSIVVDVPESMAETKAGIVVVGVAPVASGRPQPLPLVRPAADRWAGGGLTLTVAAEFAIDRTEPRDAVAVGPEVAARWPAIDPAASASAPPAAGARMHFVHQAADAVVTAIVRPRPTELDVARMTTVEISPRIVLGRAACDLRVIAGEAFEARAAVGDGWLIDTVEAVESAGDSPPAVRDAERGTATIPVDWRRTGPTGGVELRIAFAEAATRSRSVRLRISGHRAGIPLGAIFTTADMDMVRFAGESSAAVDFRAGSETVVEIDGSPVAVATVDDRLAALVEPGSSQGRIRRGERAASQAARLVQRRPPLDAEVDVQLLARDGQLTESFAFTCRPEAGDLDSVVVHFSEPLGEAVAWTRSDPRGGAILARRLERGDAARGEIGSLPGIAESWLVEFSPAARGEARFRGTRGVEFAGRRPVPLAWVEAATAPRGTLSVRGEGMAWPRLLNRRLRELPSLEADAAQAVGEFAYADPQTLLVPGSDPPAELLPADPAAARAWAWREATTCWAHASGRVECESVFDIDNHGRESVALTVPAGLSVEGITIDGASVLFDGSPPAGGELKVTLPPRRGRVSLAVRGVASRAPQFGCWRLDPVTCSIDAPVLERRLRLMLPPGLDLVVPAPHGDPGWMERLFATTWLRTAEPETSAGFQAAEIPGGDPRFSGGIVVVRRRVVAVAAIAAGLAAATAAFGAARRRPGGAAVCVVGLAIAALWLSPPFASLARAAWWGSLVGVACAWFGSVRWLAPACVWFAAAIGTAAFAEQDGGPRPFRVLVAPGGDAGTVLVPEPLFRLLAADEFAAAAAVRVVECRAAPLGTSADAPWRITIDVDADGGGVLAIDQAPCGARWRPAGESAPRGVVVTVAEEGSTARIAAVAPGRYRVALDVEPGLDSRGAVESVSFCLPPAARGTVEIAAAPPGGRVETAGAAGDWHCDRADRGGPWTAAVSASGGVGFDVSRAARVRLVRSVDPRHSILATPRHAVSTNDIDWREDGCLVNAAFEVGAEHEIVRSVVVRAADGLVPVGLRDDTGMPAVQSLGDGRFLVELPRPMPGRTRVDLQFTMPFPDPVGIFDVPGAWLEGVATDSRTVRLSAPPGFEVEPELPAGVSLLRPREDDGPRVAAVWRTELLGAAADVVAGEPQRSGRGRIVVSRRPRPPRGLQTLVVGFATDAVSLSLTCEIDATATPLTDLPIEIPAEAVIDRVGLVAIAADGSGPVDIVTSRPTPNGLVLVPQRPRTGRFTVTVEARLPGPPPPRGRIPLVRATLRGGTPLGVNWRSGRTSRVVVEGSEADEATCEVAYGDQGPEYAVVEQAPADEAGRRPATTGDVRPITPVEEAVLVAEVRLATDGRGRARGLARFDLTTSRNAVDVTLPVGMRLFDVHVDDHEAEAEPLGGDTWRVPLNAASWPHAVILTYAGEIGGAPAGGDPIRLVPPLLRGLECRDTLWTIDAPADLGLRVAESGRVIDGAELEAIHEASRRRLAAAFEAGLATAGPVEAERLQRIVERLRDGHAPAADESWQRSLAPADGEPRERVHVVVADAAVTIRGVRRPDATSPARGLATVVAAGMLAAGWSVARRWPTVMANVVVRGWPWMLAGVGAAWAALLAPPLPGWVMLVLGSAAAMRRIAGVRPRPESVPPGSSDATVGSTRTLLRS